jgi:hypothetical protein
MKRLLLPALLLFCGVTVCRAQEFHPPVMLKADGKAIRVESPGYAAPCYFDIDKGGKKDLIVGQFARGKMKVYKNLGGGKFAAGTWLQADGKVAEVPGIW